MSLDEEYPKTNRHLSRLLMVLEGDVTLDARQREELAMALDNLADKACDLEEIIQRLLKERHTPAEVGELLVAIELTTEQIRGYSDVIDGKLYDMADRLKGATPTSEGADG